MTSGGLTGPRVMGPLRQGNVRQLLRQHKGYKEKMGVACKDSVSRRPCEATELISWSNVHAISTLSGQRAVLTEEHCIAALKSLTGLELRDIDARRVGSDLRETLETDKHMQATNQILSTSGKFKAFLDESMLRHNFKLMDSARSLLGK